MMTLWGRLTHICVSKLSVTGSDNGLSPDRRQAIIWTNAGILSIGPLATNVRELLIKIHTFSFKKINLKMSSGKWRPFCLGLIVLSEQWEHGVVSGFTLGCCDFKSHFCKIVVIYLKHNIKWDLCLQHGLILYHIVLSGYTTWPSATNFSEIKIKKRVIPEKNDLKMLSAK